MQGLAVGGEYGGAVLMTAEHARPGRRGLASSAAVMGGPCGALLATAALSLVALPIVALFRERPGLLAKAVAIQLGATVAQGVFTLFGVNYAATVGYSPSVALLALLIAAVGALARTPVHAALSDRIGRRRLMLVGTVAAGLWAYPGLILINLGIPLVFIISVAAFVIFVWTAVNAVVPVMLIPAAATG